MNNRTVFFVSDQTGITAETLGHSLLTQFEGVDFRQITLPFIDTIDKANEATRKINLTAQVEGCRPIVFCTFVLEDIREIVRASRGLCLDFFDAFIGPLERELESKSSHTTGKAHGLGNDSTYTNRIDAMNFALASDDGVSTQGFARADVVLIGVSRTGKTPSCLFLALQYGVYAGNYPLNEDDFEAGDLPGVLRPHRDKLYGLTIEAPRLCAIREERRPNSTYASQRQVLYELREAEAMYRRHGIPSVNTTRASVEEIAVKILHGAGLQRRDRR